MFCQQMFINGWLGGGTPLFLLVLNVGNFREWSIKKLVPATPSNPSSNPACFPQQEVLGNLHINHLNNPNWDFPQKKRTQLYLGYPSGYGNLQCRVSRFIPIIPISPKRIPYNPYIWWLIPWNRWLIPSPHRRFWAVPMPIGRRSSATSSGGKRWSAAARRRRPSAAAPWVPKR